MWCSVQTALVVRCSPDVVPLWMRNHGGQNWRRAEIGMRSGRALHIHTPRTISGDEQIRQGLDFEENASSRRALSSSGCKTGLA